MCGIVGIFNTDPGHIVQEGTLKKMSHTLRHRGPDDETIQIDGNVGFGFMRLSIIDLANGKQPFFSEDGRIMLICNGEIFNYKELREELVAKGYCFSSNCDVEVIVPLYLEYGVGLLKKLNGQFAFALYDKKERSLFLARDHFGICPLFYSSVDGNFIFASEIKALLQHPAIKKEVNLTGLDQIFSLPGIVSPQTMFRNIYSMKPGHYMLVKGGVINAREYWDLDYPTTADEISRKPDSYYEDGLEELLLKSVSYRLNADVPVGFYLSGGLDSSLIGAMMRVTGKRNYPSFSVVYPRDGEIDESNYQQLMAAHIQSPHTPIPFDSEEVQRGLKKAVYHSETPLKETYNSCSLSLSARVRESQLKVILSGEGADEFFGGYFGYRFDVQRMQQGQANAVKRVEDILEEEIRKKQWGDPEFFYEKNEYEFAETKKAIYSDRVNSIYNEFNYLNHLDIDKEKLRNRHPFNKRSYLDFKLRLADHLISDHCDRVSYANSIEGRYPFLDIDVINFARLIPHDLKLRNMEEKYILKKIARKYVPREIYERQKYGWVAPGSPELLRANIEWVNDLLSYEHIRQQGYFNPHAVEALKKMYSKNNFKLHTSYESDLLIVVLTFNIFLELFELPNL